MTDEKMEGAIETSIEDEAPSNGKSNGRMNKFEKKRFEIYQERRARAIARGVPEDQVDNVLAREDYERLPTEEKLKRLAGAVGSDFQRVAEQMKNLRQNDGVLAESMDVNFRALSKLLAKLGVSLEEQRETMQLAAEEIRQEQMARAQAQQQRQPMPPAVVEQAITQPGPAPVPEDATVFEG